MLSYSTGESGSGADVEKVREATALVRERAPELLVEGPIQYDAAADAAVAAAKMPGSAVAGRATVFIFPDLNTGNNTYKAVQRSAGAVAIGPVLQGLNKPINDLSRGALVDDIVNTIAITAIQAQGEASRDERRPGRQQRIVVVQVPADRHGCRGRARLRASSSASARRSGDSKHTVFVAAAEGEAPSPTISTRRTRASCRSPTTRPGSRSCSTRSPSTARRSTTAPPVAVGHRVVHGGARFFEPTLITPLVEINIDELSVLAPLHNPGEPAGHRRGEGGVPRRPARRRLRHGVPPDAPARGLHLRDRRGARRRPTASAATASTARRTSSSPRPPPRSSAGPLAELKQIVFHLGNGASVTAIDGGRSVETSMGLTPLEGLVMGTRSGDIDPAVLFHLARRAGHVDRRPRRPCSTSAADCSGSPASPTCATSKTGWSRGMPRPPSPSRSTCIGSAPTPAPTSPSSAASTSSRSPPASARTRPLVRAGALETLGFAGVEIDPERNAARERGIRVDLDRCLGA